MTDLPTYFGEVVSLFSPPLVALPEPSSFVLLGLALAALLIVRCRRVVAMLLMGAALITGSSANKVRRVF